MKKQLEFFKSVTVLLDAKANSGEAAGFKEWLYGVAGAVSAAAKEGGFMGIGGERVSEKEKAALEDLKTTLGL